MTVAWEQAIAGIEANVDAAERALAAGTAPELAPFTPPALAEPLPAELADRARACRDRNDALAARIGGELDRIRSELRRLPRVPRSTHEARFDAQA